MSVLNSAARRLIESGVLAHLVTTNDDGSPQVSVVWVGLDGDELVSAHLDGRQRKLANIRRDPRVALSFEASTNNETGMRHYLVVHGRATITEGAGPAASAGTDQYRARHRVPADARPAAGLPHPCQRDPCRRPRSMDRLEHVPAPSSPSTSLPRQASDVRLVERTAA
jgi:PPOX class probable F420-dependent enzyme